MKNSFCNKFTKIFILSMIITMVLSACVETATPAPTQDVALIQTQASPNSRDGFNTERTACTNKSTSGYGVPSVGSTH